jgi:prolyl oligopeptidase
VKKSAWMFVALVACSTPKAAAPIAEAPKREPSATPAVPVVVEETAPSRFPASRRVDVVDTVYGVKVADPYRWLEDVSQPEVKAWMAEQNRVGRAYLASLPGRDALFARFKELFYIETFRAPVHKGKRWFYTRKPADQEKAIVYFRESLDGADQVFIDPNTLSPDGSVALKGYWPSDSGRYVAYSLSRNNADSAAMYIRDLTTGKDLPEVIENARYADAQWRPDERGFFYTWLPKDDSIPVADRPGFQEIRYHAIGGDPAKDEVLVPAQHDPTKFIGPDISFDGKWLFGVVSHGSRSRDIWVKDLTVKPSGKVATVKYPTPLEQDFRNAGFTPLVVGADHPYDVEAWKGAFYVTTTDGAARGQVFRVDPKKPERAAWKVVVPERADATLHGARVIGGHLVLDWFHDVKSELEVRTLAGKPVRMLALDGIGTVDFVNGRPDEDALFYGFSSHLAPTQVFQTSVKSGKTSLWRGVKVAVDAASLVVEQVWYPSKDGTKIPMFLLHRKDWTKNGANPTYLYGYGGFNVPQLPTFNPLWVLFAEKGGVVALPNLRGGGELGEEWHRAGMLEKKQNVFDDFIAAGDWLVAEKIASHDTLAISGRSNGGLLVGAVMTQRPDLAKAVVCGVPLLDMVRYHLFGSGKTWSEEYGTAEDETLFKAILAYSPYQHVVRGTKYPALLMYTSDTDDRVDPLHARKFTAAIQWATSSADAPVVMRIEANAGHSGADMVGKAAELNADMAAFLFAQLGMK